MDPGFASATVSPSLHSQSERDNDSFKNIKFTLVSQESTRPNPLH